MQKATITTSRRQGRLLAAIMCTILLVGAQWQLAEGASQAKTHSASKKVTSQLSIGRSTSVVAGNDYLGISLEMSGLCQLLHVKSQHSTRLRNLLRNLGSTVLKVAGKGSDYATWKASGRAKCSTFGTVLTSSEIRSFFKFAKHAGLQIIWGLPLARYNPKQAAAQAKFVASVAGNALLAWSIGNEPDLYTRGGVRHAAWSFSSFYSQWKNTRDAVVKAVPHVAVTGPDQCCVPSYFNNFAAKARGEVSALSFHFYAGSRTDQTAQYLLGSTANKKVVSRLKNYWRQDSRTTKVPLWITEANTFPLGGMPGVSDAFVSSLWLTDFLFDAASLRVSQVDVQEIGNGAAYDPMDTFAQPRPLYYGMLLYHAMVPAGAHFVYTKLKTSTALTSYADRVGSGTLHVVVINKGTRASQVQVNVGGQYGTASFYRLEAPKLGAQSGVLLGGNPISANGTWSPKSQALGLHSGKGTLSVPPGSAVGMTFSTSSARKLLIHCHPCIWRQSDNGSEAPTAL